MSRTIPPSQADAELLARFLEEYEQAADRAAVLRRWIGERPERAAQLAALVAADAVLGRVRPEAEPPPPERLGDFRILRPIAGGGMGVVYEARQEPFGRRVAVKTMRPRHFSEQARDRFLREQRVLAGLHQTHIVPIYAAGRAGDLDYFAMPFIDGVSLHDVVGALRTAPPGGNVPALGVLARRLKAAAGGGAGPAPARLSPAYFRSAAEVIADAAEAIDHAHGCGILHRDLKPANVMVDVAGHAWVLDFGLAGYFTAGAAASAGGEAVLVSGALSAPGLTLGTLDYMAPEQLDGAVDARTDVWGLGAVLYELLTLHRPFAGATDEPDAASRRRRELAGTLVPPRALMPGLPRDLEAVCLKCLQKDPSKRYAAACGLADDLRRWLRGEETTARPSGPLRRAGRWAGRHPAWAGVLAAAAALLLLAALVAGSCREFEAGNARAARKLADTVDKQFDLVRLSVRATARELEKDPEWMRDPAVHGDDLQKFLTETREDFDHRVKWFRRPGEAAPFVNWFLMDRDGVILVDSTRPFSGDYRDRDYSRLLDDPDPDHEAVYFSRVFKSALDHKYKFAVGTRVWDGDRLLGLVLTTMALDSRMVALDMTAELPGAALVCPMDRSRKPGDGLPEDAALPEWVVVLHADYARSGEDAACPDDDALAALRAFADDPGLRQAAQRDYLGGRVADFARVGGTHFVAVVERPYPWPIDWLLAGSLRCGVLVAVAGLGAVAVRGWYAVRRA